MRKILIVDDEFIVRVGIKSFLDWEENGYTIVGEAADGGEALDMISQFHPDVVLTDLKMAGMDGFELISVSRKQFPKVKFVVLSSFDDVENVKRAMKLGAVDYIFKLTTKPQELLDILNSLSYEEQENDMERVVRKSMPAIKNRLIRLAAQKHYPSPSRLLEEFREVGLSTDFSQPYCVVYFPFDTGTDGETDTQVMKYAMENMIQEVLSESFSVETYSFTGDSLLSVIACGGLDGESLEDTLRQDVQKIYEYVRRYLGLHISAALSPSHKGIEQFPTAVAACRRTMDECGGKADGELQTGSNRLRPEIQTVKQYVVKHIDQDFTVKQAAQLCSMSESYFSHLFKKEMGLSFVDYVNQQRVRAAEKLLLHTDMRINEVAAAVGVDNPNYFSVLFKKVRGESPQTYRRRKGAW